MTNLERALYDLPDYDRDVRYMKQLSRALGFEMCCDIRECYANLRELDWAREEFLDSGLDTPKAFRDHIDASQRMVGQLVSLAMADGALKVEEAIFALYP